MSREATAAHLLSHGIEGNLQTGGRGGLSRMKEQHVQRPGRTTAPGMLRDPK